MEKKQYCPPRLELTSVKAETGFMEASVFDPAADQDKGVTIEGHEVGNTGDYTELGWDGSTSTNSFGDSGF